MDREFTALASRVAARAEVIGCIILSRDGLVLGAFPPGGEGDVTPAWTRFAALGEPQRGFVQFEHEIWAYAREGHYAAFAVGEASCRAGVLLDLMEQALLATEEARSNLAAMEEPTEVDLSRQDWKPPIRPDAAAPPPPDQDEIDRVILAREFSQLLQEVPGPAEEDQ